MLGEPKALRNSGRACLEHLVQSWRWYCKQNAVGIESEPVGGHQPDPLCACADGVQPFDRAAEHNRHAGVIERPPPHRDESVGAVWRLPIPPEFDLGVPKDAIEVCGGALVELEHGHSHRACNTPQGRGSHPRLGRRGHLPHLHEIGHRDRVARRHTLQRVEAGGLDKVRFREQRQVAPGHLAQKLQYPFGGEIVLGHEVLRPFLDQSRAIGG